MNALPRPASITAITPLSADTTLFQLHVEGNPGFNFSPGQFVQLSVPGGGEVPISLAGPSGDGGNLELCIRRVGRVTALLHAAHPGDHLAIRGPFGQGFPLGEMAGNDILLLAGGLGIAPLRSLLYHLLANRRRYGAITLMYGAREPAAMLFRDEFVHLSAGNEFRLLLTVDFVREELPTGTVCAIGLLPSLLTGISFNGQQTAAAICGPPPLYRCTIDALTTAGCPEERIYVSLERRMHCGQGLCSHCAVGDLLCCTDGPVFRYSDVKAIPGAL